jgi:hypothetical protein
MNANLVKYGKYGAVALVVGLVAYTLVQKNKKAKVAKALAEAKAAAEAKSAALKAAAEKKYSAANVKGDLTFKPAGAFDLDKENVFPID